MRNIVLIGMPGSGKSTIGPLLAKHTLRDFIDTDLLIQRRTGVSLQTTLEQDGYQALRDVEAQVLLECPRENTVIATGGSAVYSEAAMHHLAQSASVVYLRVSLSTLEQRLGDTSERGIAATPGSRLSDIYAERCKLYERFATYVIDNEACSAEQAVLSICQTLS